MTASNKSFVPVDPNFDRILVTAALPYANGKIHLGHLAGAYLPADIYVRYQRAMNRDILFICGSDEHGVPIIISADQEKITPQAVVDRYHGMNKKAFQAFGMSFDNYSRTSLPIHHETAREFFSILHKNGILVEKNEKQLFDAKANMFLPDRYVEGTCPVCKNTDARGDQCEQCGTYLNPTELIDPRSKITGETPTVRETTHWYFPLGRYQERLKKFVDDADKRDGWKDNVLGYCRTWFKDGLGDRAVTRDLPWGVKVPLPGYDNKVLYVWFDAVLGYISATKEWALQHETPDAWKSYWLSERTKYIPFIGKDNIVFHCIVFPAILMARNDAGGDQYILPENVPANEFLNFASQKFSKSRGWGVDLDEFLESFPPDALRYTLAMNLPEARDADFTWQEFQSRTNNELADILGNFVNRTLTFLHKNYGGIIPAPGEYNGLDQELLTLMRTTPAKAGQQFERYHFRDGILDLMNLARFANKYFNDSEPWKTAKTDPPRCATTLNLCMQTVRSLAILFEPVIPHTCAAMWNMLALDGKPADAGWETAGSPLIATGHRTGTPSILIAKIEDEAIQARLAVPATTQELGVPVVDPKRPAVNTATPGVITTDQVAQIAIDDFKKVQLRIAKVISAERLPKSEKLLKLRVSLGDSERQILAGIANRYAPEDLIGLKIVIVANLAPAKLMGQESQGMLLAASDAEGGFSVLTVARDVKEGASIK